MQPIIRHVQGDDCDYDFAVVDENGDAENIAGWAFWFTVKSAVSQLDAAALFQLTSDAGEIVIDEAAAGLGRIIVRAANTKGKTPGSYQFDFQCRKGVAGTKIQTLNSGFFNLTAEITLAE